MAALPTADQINEVCSFTGLDEATANILLRNYNNNSNNAINAYFEDPVGSIKESAPANEWQYQDNAPFADDSSTGAVPSMSRPPSRADNKLPFLDLSAETAAASANHTLTLKEQEELLNDRELQRAMAESMRQGLPAQENGVAGVGTHFGPANRDHYDPSSWAMTTFSTSREIIEHSPPSKRRRLNDEPAFLRGSKETEYLGPLLTIYHSIPLAREALLMPALKVHTYGHDPSWWAGTSDENTKALSTDNTLRIDWDGCHLLAEVQCLMAFLDETNRAYGSVDALADLQAVRTTNEDGPIGRFLSAWTAASLQQAPEEQLTQVFTSVAVKGAVPGQSLSEEKSLQCVTAPANHHLHKTLIDILDFTIWHDEMGSIDDVWIDQAAEIFTVRVNDPYKKGDGLDLSIDPLWYPDRYMLECRETTLQMRKQMRNVRREIDQCDSIKRRCEVIRLPDNRTLVVRDVLNEASNSWLEADNNASSAEGIVEKVSSSEDTIIQSSISDVASDLRKVLERIDAKLQQLEQRKSELQAGMTQIAMQLTKPTPESPNMPYRKYSLQGVSTTPYTTYVRRRDRDLLHLEEEADDSGWQWWKASWLQNPAQDQAASLPEMGPATEAQTQAQVSTQKLGFAAGLPADGIPTAKSTTIDIPKSYEIRKVHETDVLEAIKKEHESVLLVYANQNALDFQGSELSVALKHFADRDNQAFTEELEREEGRQPSSVERSTDIDFESIPLIDPNGSSSSVQELTPMSTASPGRDLDGQPSPKRARENNSMLMSEDLPSYEESLGGHEMQERNRNKIGLYAEQMLERYGESEDTEKDEGSGSSARVEHAD